MKFTASLLFFIISLGVYGQTGNLNVNVYDEFSKKPIVSEIWVKNSAFIFSGDGNVLIEELPSGTYTLVISSAEYETGILKAST